jgi:microcompartment protein CcmL/EutN
MKTYPAIAAFEFDDIAVGVWVTDAMLKRAPIAFFKSGTITAGRYLTLIGGTTASVSESAGEAVRHADSHLLDHVFLPDVHPRLYAGVLGARRSRASGAVAVLETTTVSASVRAAEAALKGTPVELVEIRLGDSGLAGKGLIVLEGELHDVDAAVSMALERAGEGAANASCRVIAAPHDALFAQIAHASAFAVGQIIDLEGETI